MNNLVLTGAGWSLYGKGMREYVYACPLRHRDKWPTSLSVATASQLENLSYSTTTVIPVEVQVRPGHKEALAVCVHVAYGHIEPARLVEWLEFQRILGVSMVGVYLMSNFSQATERVFR